MKFLDEVEIKIIAGKGGNGIVSFRREKFVPRGGPDGGDGGDGGSIYFVGSKDINTLIHLHHLKTIKGFDGENGKSKNKTGCQGKDRFIKVPIGTMVFENNKKIIDIISEEKYLIAKGGKGGRGNTRFKSSRNTVPRIFENGLSGEKKHFFLSLKILSDIGLIGVPSAGKSTILSSISNANPKIANYPFTTLVPQLGLVKVFDKSFVIADLPGLIKGASIGKGLGIEFLKHIERCKMVAHVLDFGKSFTEILKDYQNIRNELRQFNISLGRKREVIIANKMDLKAADSNLKKFKSKYKNKKIIAISALLNQNIDLLKKELLKLLSNETSKKTTRNKGLQKEIYISLDRDIVIKKQDKNTFIINGKTIEKICEKIPFTAKGNIYLFVKELKKHEVISYLKKHKIKENDILKFPDRTIIFSDLKIYKN